MSNSPTLEGPAAPTAARTKRSYLGWLLPLTLPAQLTARTVIALTALIAVAAAVPRFYDLGQAIHADSLHWIHRTHNFWEALADGNFSATYQHAHPGVTLMWLSGISLKLAGLLGAPIDEALVIAAKFPLAFIGTLSAALTFPLLLAGLGKEHWRPALLVALLFATEPLLIETSRMLHLDMTGAGLMWLGLLVALWAFRRDSLGLAGLAGALMAAACLTRLSLAPTAVGSVLMLAAKWPWSRFQDRRGIRVAVVISGSALLAAFILWPALWASPEQTIRRLVRGTESVVSHGHLHVVNGKQTRDPGAMFYVRFALGATPFDSGLLALIGVVCAGLQKELRKQIAWLIGSVVFYLVVIALLKKKLDRYVLPLFPLLALAGGMALEWLLRRSSQLRRALPTVAACAIIALFCFRYGRALASLPTLSVCTDWPGVAENCSQRGRDMYYMREIALALKADWERAPNHGSRPGVHKSSKPKLMTPWLPVKTIKRIKDSDYVILWDRNFADDDGLELDRSFKRKHRKLLGPVVHELKVDGKLLARAHRVIRR